MTRSEPKDPIRVWILTVSDRVYQDLAEDRSGPAIRTWLESHFNVEIIGCSSSNRVRVVPDEPVRIQSAIEEALRAHPNAIDLILTTGGTGFGRRDQTPEAIRPLLSREAPGLVHAILEASLKITPFAMLSRPVAGILQDRTIVLTLPGKPKACTENLDAIASVLLHAVELVRGDSGEKTHQKMTSGVEQRHGCTCEVGQELGNVEMELSDPLEAAVPQRSRVSPFPMVPFQEALDRISKQTLPCTHCTEILSVNETLVGRTLSETVYAPVSVPNFCASTVDGYAMDASLGAGVFPVQNGITAGEATIPTLKPGSIARITTGAPVPQGATAVVMVEHTECVQQTETEEIQVYIRVAPKPGQNIRPVGCDIEKGQLLLPAGTKIDAFAGHIGLLLSAGIANVRVQSLVRVGVLSTGNEIHDVRDPPPSMASVVDSNRPSLIALLQQFQPVHIVDLGIVRDEAEALQAAMEQALQKVDILVTTGGVSMGELDLIKPILQHKLHATIHFGRIQMKPGKPTTFATVDKGPANATNRKYVFGLPGNPVSAWVTCYLFVQSCLRMLQSGTPFQHSRVAVRLAHSIVLDRERAEFHRGTRQMVSKPGTTPTVTSTGNQLSSRLESMCKADCLLILPAGKDVGLDALEEGTIVDAIPFYKI